MSISVALHYSLNDSPTISILNGLQLDNVAFISSILGEVRNV
jgi:hypothetical protein